MLLSDMEIHIYTHIQAIKLTDHSTKSVIPLVFHYRFIRYMVQLTVSSAVQGLLFRCIEFTNSIGNRKWSAEDGVLSSSLEKVLKWAIESWLSTANQKAAD